MTIDFIAIELDQTQRIEFTSVMTDSFNLIDTHTGGEITRVVMAADLGLNVQTANDLLNALQSEKDWVRKSLTDEPRGSAFAVGAVVAHPGADGGPWIVVFFNNTGYLGMCGHGLIGVVEALCHADRLSLGTHSFETPPGNVVAKVDENRQVSFTGVPSFCLEKDVHVTCEDGATVVGDVAYGGNWFFLVSDIQLADKTRDQLMSHCNRIRRGLESAGICGADGAEIDHIELCAPLVSERSARGCQNFVLCPGGHFDRSPCGTGTSAKVACLAERGQLQPGELWVSQSITGSRFLASYRNEDNKVRVTVRGRAHVIAESRQIFDSDDPLRFGMSRLLQ